MAGSSSTTRIVFIAAASSTVAACRTGRAVASVAPATALVAPAVRSVVRRSTARALAGRARPTLRSRGPGGATPRSSLVGRRGPSGRTHPSRRGRPVRCSRRSAWPAEHQHPQAHEEQDQEQREQEEPREEPIPAMEAALVHDLSPALHRAVDEPLVVRPGRDPDARRNEQQQSTRTPIHRRFDIMSLLRRIDPRSSASTMDGRGEDGVNAVRRSAVAREARATIASRRRGSKARRDRTRDGKPD